MTFRLAILTLLLLAELAFAQARSAVELNLERAVELALVGNPDYLGLLNNVERAELDLEQARSLFKTQIVTSFDSDARTGAQIGSFFQVGVRKRSTSGSAWSLGLHGSTFGDDSLSEVRLSYSLPFFKDPVATGRYTLAQAELDFRHRQRVRLLGAEELIMQVVSAYFGAALADNGISIAKEDVLLAEKLQRATDLRKRTGRSSELDLHHAKLRVAQARQRHEAARLDRVRADNRLKLLLGLDLDDSLLIDRDLPAVLKLDLASLDEDTVEQWALEHRSDLLSLGEDLELAGRKLRGRVGKRRPNLDVRLQYSLIGEGNSFVDSFKVDDRRIGIGISLDLNLSKSAQDEKRRLMLFYEDKQRAYDKLAMQIRSDARLALLGLRDKTTQLRLSIESTRLAEQQFEFLSLRYRAGQVSTQDVLEAQQNLARSRHAELKARVDHLLAHYQLEKITGSLTERWTHHIDDSHLFAGT